jgi:hypothetical protein
MTIGLIDVDGHNFPNLALMKISAWHKAKGDTVEWCIPLAHYDIVYQSKVFDETYSEDIDWIPQADKVIKGGTGYFRRDKKGEGFVYYRQGWISVGRASAVTLAGENIVEFLPYEVEHMYPDYSLYPELTKETSFGYLSRGCPRACSFCLVALKEGRKSIKVADLDEFWSGQKNIKLFDPNLLACKEHLNLLQQLIDSKAYVDFTQGLDIRLTTEANISLINKVKVKNIHFAWDNPKDDLRPYFERYKALAKHKPHGGYGTVYCLVNYGSTMEENLYRIYTLRDLGYDPYVMIYDKPNAPREIRLLQRWVNNKPIFKKCEKFEDFDPKKG